MEGVRIKAARRLFGRVPCSPVPRTGCARNFPNFAGLRARVGGSKRGSFHFVHFVYFVHFVGFQATCVPVTRLVSMDEAGAGAGTTSVLWSMILSLVAMGDS